MVPVTVIVPAFNEGASLADTLISLLTQTVAPAEILVVDDCSTDDTADVAARLGVTVLRPPANTGSKAGAQSFALGQVKTACVMAIDAVKAAGGTVTLVITVVDREENEGVAALEATGAVVESLATRSEIIAAGNSLP